jgi:hypothetical protein
MFSLTGCGFVHAAQVSITDAQLFASYRVIVEATRERER